MLPMTATPNDEPMFCSVRVSALPAPVSPGGSEARMASRAGIMVNAMLIPITAKPVATSP